MAGELTPAISLADAQGFFNRGLHLLKSGNWKDALADFTEAIKLRPDIPIGYRYRAYAHADSGNVPRRSPTSTKRSGSMPTTCRSTSTALNTSYGRSSTTMP